MHHLRLPASRALLVCALCVIQTVAFADAYDLAGQSTRSEPSVLAGSGQPASSTGQVVEGPRPYVTLLCKYGDLTELEPVAVERVDAAVGSSYPGVAHFWNEVSGGRLQMTGKAFGWYTLPRPKAEYDGQWETFAHDCAAAADLEVHFPDYVGINFLPNADIGGFVGRAGSVTLSLDGITRTYHATWTTSGGVGEAPLTGTIMHEVGHTLGLPHSGGPYGSDYDSPWDIMSSSSWYRVPGTGDPIGAHTNGYHKRWLGWIPPERELFITPGTHTFLLERSANPEDNSNFLLAHLPTPGFQPSEYYLLEARGPSGYDEPLPGHGVVIHRIGGGGSTWSTVLDLDGNGVTHDRGSVVEVGEWFFDPLNGISLRVDEEVGSAYQVTVTLADYPRVRVEPAERKVTVRAGDGTVWVDSTMVLMGGHEPGAAWVAEVLYGPSLTLNTPTGTGDGVLRWSLDTGGLGAGSHCGLLRVSTDGGVAAPLEYCAEVEPTDVLHAGLGTTRVHRMAVVGDSTDGAVGVVMSGPGADTAGWTITSDAPWIRLRTASGTGNGYAAWDRITDGLAAGTHVAILEVSVPGAAGSPVLFTDSLRLLDAPILTMPRRGATSIRVPEGGFPVADSIYVELSGWWADSASWGGSAVATTRYIFGSPARVGSGWYRFTRDPRGLAPGAYTATHVFRPFLAPHIQLEVQDTLYVDSAPLAIKLSWNSRQNTVVGATTMSRDSVLVAPQGPDAATREWRAELSSGLRLDGATGTGLLTGRQWVRWFRALDGRAPGLQVDTIRFFFHSGAGEPAVLLDSLYVSGGPALALDHAGRSAMVDEGTTIAPGDSTVVRLSGWNAGAIGWTASTTAPWVTFLAQSGTGTGTLRWSRDPSGLAPGSHIATLTVTAAATGSPALLVDTLHVGAPFAITGTRERPDGTMGAPYVDSLIATAASDEVRWAVVSGSLPPGLSLDSTTGRITGVPESAGTYGYNVEASAGSRTAEADLIVIIVRPVLAATAVLDHLLLGTGLGEDHQRFLDLLGNRNGRVDIGDVRAWLQDAAVPDSPESQQLRQIVQRRDP
jgi:hypothetical protein